MDPANTANVNVVEVGGILLVAMVLARGLVEVVKLLISRLQMRNGGSDAAKAKLHPDAWRLIREIANGTNELVKAHSRTDEDGIPLWYMPRSMVKAFERMTKAMELSVRLLEDINRKTDKCPIQGSGSTGPVRPITSPGVDTTGSGT